MDTVDQDIQVSVITVLLSTVNFFRKNDSELSYRHIH